MDDRNGKPRASKFPIIAFGVSVVMLVTLGLFSYKFYTETNQQLADQSKVIQQLQDQSAEAEKVHTSEISELEKKIAEHQAVIAQRDQQLAEANNQISSIQAELAEKEKELNEVMFAKSLSYPVALSSFSTEYKAGGGRGENIRIATESVDGRLLMPGKSVSFNSLTGPRSRSNGYQLASVIVNGKYVDGYGGGVCQVSSTLFNAALLGGLEIDQRTNHSKKSSYVSPGRDATVTDSGLDLILRNDLDFPVVIHGIAADGVCTFMIMAPEGAVPITYEIAVEQLNTHSFLLHRFYNGVSDYSVKSTYKD